jgi:REP element-mobilizing transposase RayT
MKPMRLRGFNYRSAETYFITVCLSARSSLFGDVTDDGILSQSSTGNMIVMTLIAIPDQFLSESVEDFVVMPDHVHALIATDSVEPPLIASSLGEVVGWFKGATTHRYGKGVASLGWPRYQGGLWQPGYHDHIARDERDFQSRSLYIERNPMRWLEKRQGEQI